MRPRPAPNFVFSLALCPALCLVGSVGCGGGLRPAARDPAPAGAGLPAGTPKGGGDPTAKAAVAWETLSVAGACAEMSPHLDALPGQRLDCDPAHAGCGSPFFADATRDLALTCANPASAAGTLSWSIYQAPQRSEGGRGGSLAGDAVVAQPAGFAVLATRRDPSLAYAGATVQFASGAQVGVDSRHTLGLSGDFEGGLLLARGEIPTGGATLQHVSATGAALGPEIPWVANAAGAPLAAAVDVQGRVLLIRRQGDALTGEWRASDLSPLGGPFAAGAAPGNSSLALTAAPGGGLLTSDFRGWGAFIPSGEARLLPVPNFVTAWSPPDPTSIPQFFTVFAGRAWGRLECHPNAAGCVQTVRVVTADGTTCGRLSLRDPSSAAGVSIDAAFAGGTVLQAGPAQAASGAVCASVRWWPGVLR
jgi:hypothetical protein